MNDYTRRTENIFRRLHELAACTEEPNAITRIFGTEAFFKGRDKVVQWMQQAGMQVRTDSMGNVRGRLSAEDPAAKTFVIASHIDTVRNAGMFDGSLGVIMGIELVSQVYNSNTPLPFHLEMIAFSEEEGVRFQATFLGSRLVAGSFDRNLLPKEDDQGVSLQAVLESMGSDLAALETDAIPAGSWLGYFEIHIEQGPVLYEKNFPAALVTGIAGQKRVEVRFIGMAGHAGTVPLYMRHDALCCAAEFILENEALALLHAGKIVSTVGKLHILNAAGNVIPGDLTLSVDIRGEDVTSLAAAYASLQERCAEICEKRSIMYHWKLLQDTPPVACDPALSDLLSASVKAITGTSTRLVSGAGHDAVAVSAVAPVSMLFVRCFEGISHNPLEYAEPGDVSKALEISAHFINLLIKKHNLS